MAKKSTQKILICDDEESIHEALRLILENHFDLIMVKGGKECLECLDHAKDIGLILLDIKMPKMNGFEVLKIIREKNPAIPVAMVTGYHAVDIAATSVSLGAQGYLCKPLVAEEVLASVNRWMGVTNAK